MLSENNVAWTFNDDPDVLKNVLTGNKSWLLGYGIEIKSQSSQWKRPEYSTIIIYRHFRIDKQSDSPYYQTSESTNFINKF